MVLAYRFAYETIVGPIPDGLQLDHLCHNQSGCEGGPDCLHRKCVNPGHLEPVTNDENAARRAGMKFTVQCQTGTHDRSPENVRITTTGIRMCRTCSPDVRADLDDVCANGHPRTPENTYIYDRCYINRKCRACQREATRRYRARRVAAILHAS